MTTQQSQNFYPNKAKFDLLTEKHNKIISNFLSNSFSSSAKNTSDEVKTNNTNAKEAISLFSTMNIVSLRQLYEKLDSLKSEFKNLTSTKELICSPIFIYNMAIVQYNLGFYDDCFYALNPIISKFSIDKLKNDLENEIQSFDDSKLQQSKLVISSIYALLNLYFTAFKPTDILSSFLKENFNKFLLNKLSFLESVFQQNVQHRFQLPLFKSRFYLINHDTKAARREIKNSLEIYQKNVKELMPGSGDTLLCFAKSNLDYVRGKYSNALKHLNSCDWKANEQFHSAYLNNVGCILHQTCNYASSYLHFIRALKLIEQHCLDIKKLTSKNKVSFSSNVSNSNCFTPLFDSRQPHSVCIETLWSSVLFNCGLSLLKRCNSVEEVSRCSEQKSQAIKLAKLAFNCFRKILVFYQNDPEYQLRLGECCITIYNLQFRFKHQNSANFRNSLIQKQNSQKIVLTQSQETTFKFTHFYENNLLDKDDKNTQLKFDPQNKEKRRKLGIDLTDALDYLKNSIVLLYNNDKNFSGSIGTLDQIAKHKLSFDLKTCKDDKVSDKDDFSASMPTTDKKRLRKLKETALLNIMYVCLCLIQPNQALHHASMLFQTLKPIENRKTLYLAHLYSAEALCILGRASEATRHLNPSFLPDIVLNNEDPSSKTGASTTPEPDLSLSTSATNLNQETSSLKSNESIKNFPDFIKDFENNGVENTENQTSNIETISNANSCEETNNNNKRNKNLSLPYVNSNQSSLDPNNCFLIPSIGVRLENFNAITNKAALYNNLSIAYILKGETSKALKCVSKALMICPEFLPALRTLVFIQLKNGQKTSAIQIILRHPFYQQSRYLSSTSGSQTQARQNSNAHYSSKTFQQKQQSNVNQSFQHNN